VPGRQGFGKSASSMFRRMLEYSVCNTHTHNQKINIFIFIMRHCQDTINTWVSWFYVGMVLRSLHFYMDLVIKVNFLVYHC